MTYTYQCEACERVFDAQQSITDLPLTRCDTCAGHVHRIIYPPALSFQGGGWVPSSHGVS